jgi:hypothetical protein
MIFIISDLIIGITLIINAFVLSSSKIGIKEENDNIYDNVIYIPNNITNNSNVAPNAVSSSINNFTILYRLRILIYKLRKYSCVIAMYNVIFLLFMILVFESD